MKCIQLELCLVDSAANIFHVKWPKIYEFFLIETPSSIASDVFRAAS